MRNLKNENGITLIALVVTIVVMIILASITINATLGEGGLLQQTREQNKRTQNKITADEEELNVVEQEFINQIISEDT